MNKNNRIIAKSALTTKEIAGAINIAPEVVEEDVGVIQPYLIDTGKVSFPAQILIFRAIAESEEIGLVRGYIGSVKHARIVGDEIESGEISYMGRIVLEVKGQEQVDSYLVTEGNEKYLTYLLVHIENGVIKDTEPTAKLIFMPNENKAIISYSDGNEVILNILSLERRAIKPSNKETFDSSGVIKSGVEIKESNEEVIAGIQGVTDENQNNLRERRGLFSWIRNIFGINSNFESSNSEDNQISYTD